MGRAGAEIRQGFYCRWDGHLGHGLPDGSGDYESARGAVEARELGLSRHASVVSRSDHRMKQTALWDRYPSWPDAAIDRCPSQHCERAAGVLASWKQGTAAHAGVRRVL